MSSLTRQAQRASSVASLLQTVPRRHASAAFAHMKVKKNNWIEQNEILRENKFVNWELTGKNLLPITMMAVVIPSFFWYIVKKEMAQREELTGRPVTERF